MNRYRHAGRVSRDMGFGWSLALGPGPSDTLSFGLSGVGFVGCQMIVAVVVDMCRGTWMRI
jgi:hypothetical protein